MELDTELTGEREYVEVCRAALARLVRGAQDRVLDGAGVLDEEGVSGDGASAEALGRYLRSQAKELREEPEGPPFFGRLDFGAGSGTGTGAGDHAGQRYYIGRRRIAEHPSAPPLVLDWRAPVSRAFYQATALDPRGVDVRRRFGWAPGARGTAEELTGLEDEPLTTGSGEGGDALSSGIVASEIERPRVGPMRDIVATIQPDQDDLVRAGLAETVCVQGAPGTGKTAVGLHRAAYLLYTYPRRVQRGGLLVLGPNRAFLGYISEVLPSLGEVGVRQCVMADVLDAASRGWQVRAEDSPRAAALKHGARMAAVLERALYARVRTPDEPVAVPDGSYRWRLGAGELSDIVAETREQAPPYEVGRERVRARAVALLRAQAERRAGPPSNEWLRRMGRTKAVKEFLDAAWPRVRPEEVLAELLGDPDALERAADGLLDAEERKELLWTRPPRSFKSARWSEADLVLLDEIAGLIAHPEESYGHVVVDEAQDLSPMECRAVARRSRFGSLTVLGDLAQGTTPWAARSWPEQLRHLGAEGARVAPLTTGFRVPAAIVELANRLLGSLDVEVPPARSLRRDGGLRIERVPAAESLAPAATDAVRAALGREGSVGVMAADARVAEVRAALEAAGIATGTAEETGESGAGTRVTVLPATLAKGLEYDHVVLLEPAEIVDAEPRGTHRLYVVLTRAVSALHVLHARPLPGALAG
ncbi:HelD family protein [Streptomyces sp. NPDC048172]|uniref:HelD family protein n=1 Tax=Streptomyces sp. NPDC048172 TaxID=3365505 RepID=UPI00370FE4EC